MKKALLKFAALVCIIGSMSSCTTTDSAEVALVVDQMGNDKGIPNVTPASGFVFYFPPTQDVFTYPTSIQHKVWAKVGEEESENGQSINVTSSDGATFGLDVALNLQLKRESAKDVFIKYRISMDELLQTRVRAIVRKTLRDESVNFASDSLIQHGNVYEDKVNLKLAEKLEKEGFTSVTLAILKADMPASYRNAINNKIKVIQETATIKSQTLKAEQQALQKVAEAKGNFEAAEYDAKTKAIMSQPKMLELYRAETERVWAEQGVSPYGSNNVFGSSGNILLNRK
jgi:regulator of protease activity HflC (stomatin/prohibitin superfamily)